MKKLKLDVDALEVQSFSTLADRRPVGTVRGHDTDLRCQGTAMNMTCGFYDTCVEYSCDGICGTYFCTDESCGGTCDPYGCGTGGTRCNQPCVYTCDGANPCNANHTCIQTCAGQASCPESCTCFSCWPDACG